MSKKRVFSFVEIDIATVSPDPNPNVDYFVQITGSAGPEYKHICQVTSPTVCVNTPTFRWLGNGVQITSIDSDGDLAFLLRSFYYVGGFESTGDLDRIPDADANGAVWIRTHAVHEPATLLLRLGRQPPQGHRLVQTHPGGESPASAALLAEPPAPEPIEKE